MIVLQYANDLERVTALHNFLTDGCFEIFKIQRLCHRTIEHNAFSVIGVFQIKIPTRSHFQIKGRNIFLIYPYGISRNRRLRTSDEPLDSARPEYLIAGY